MGGLPAAAGQKGGGHTGHIGLGHGIHLKGGGVGGQIAGEVLRAVLRRQGVLALEDVLHPVGDGADLAVHGVLHILQGVLQSLIVLGHLVQPAEEVDQHHHQGQNAAPGQRPGPPLPGAGRCFSG